MINFNPDFNITEKIFGDQVEYQTYEAARLSGYKCFYLQANEIANNKIFGESTAREFLVKNGVEMYFLDDEQSSYSGSEFFGGFDMLPNYNKKIFIATKEFTNEDIEPIEGDVILDTTYNILFEITKVDPLTETLTGNKINNRRMSYQIYLKHYQFNYEDSFENINEFDDAIEDFNLDDLEALNEELTADINEMNIISTDRKNPFGDLD